MAAARKRAAAKASAPVVAANEPMVPELPPVSDAGLPWRLPWFQVRRIEEAEEQLRLCNCTYMGWCVVHGAVAVDMKRGDEIHRYVGRTLYEALALAVKDAREMVLL